MAKYLRGNLAVFIYLQKFFTYTVYMSSSLSAYMTRPTVKVFQLMRFTAVYGKTSEGGGIISWFSLNRESFPTNHSLANQQCSLQNATVKVLLQLAISHSKHKSSLLKSFAVYGTL